jgi:hypothetical protein
VDGDVERGGTTHTNRVFHLRDEEGGPRVAVDENMLGSGWIAQLLACGTRATSHEIEM